MHHRPSATADSSAGNNNGVAGSTGAGSYFSTNRQAFATSSNENSLREIRDSLGPYRADCVTSAYSAKSLSSSQAVSVGGTLSESSSSSVNASSSFWSSSQQLHQMLPPGGFPVAPANVDPNYNGGGFGSSTGQFPKSVDMQAMKFRPAGTHHKEALIQIKQSLQPYSTAAGAYWHDGAGNMDTLSSESSSGTTGSVDTATRGGSPLQESLLLDQLVQMGFERESAWYALKLTQFRNLNLAVDVLLKINMSHVFRDQDAKSSVSRKASFESGENSGGRSESPMPRIPTPQSRQYQSGMGASNPASSRPSPASTSAGMYSSVPTGSQRTPSPLSKPLRTTAGPAGYQNLVATSSASSAAVANHFPHTSSGGAGGTPGYFAQASATKRSHITVNLQSPSRNGGTRGNGGCPAADSFLVKERAAPVILQADKRQVEKPVAQHAVSPTIISVNNGISNSNKMSALVGGADRQQDVSSTRPHSMKVLSARFDPQNLHSVRINVQPTCDPGNGGHYVYQLDAVGSGHNVSIQGRGDCSTLPTSAATDASSDSTTARRPCRPAPHFPAAKLPPQRVLFPSPLDVETHSSNETLPSHEKPTNQPTSRQHQLSQLRHHILVQGNGPSETCVPEYQTEHHSRFQLTTNPAATTVLPHARKVPAVPPQNVADSSTMPDSVPHASAPFVPLPARFGFPRAFEYFPVLKEETTSQQLASRLDGASPTGSVSTEESENGVYSVSKAGVDAADPIRCESPLPDTFLQRFRPDPGDGAIGANCKKSVKPCTPQAFKFFMEQHVENVIKQHRERQTRRMQLEKEMVKAKLTAQVQCQMRKLLNNKESNYLRMKRQKMNATTFEKLKTIGVGAFGEVALVRKKDTGTLFAMKTLNKSDVIQKNQAAHVKAERDILSEADNEWVVKLFYSFQDKEHLFFIMEYIPGGDMMALLIKKGIFEEDLARFYVAELVCAIQSVHKLGFIHRDIKPDNILIDRNGHIKLTDFGLCTGLRWTHEWKYYADNPVVPGHRYEDSFDRLQRNEPDTNHKVLAYRAQKSRQQSHSLVGTPNYIAPEVLSRSGHTQLCDWWSVGVILYEMVVGHPPFLANTPEETQKKVIHWRSTLVIAEEACLSPATEDLIRRLCCGVEERLGREKNASDIVAHPFFETVNWSTLRSSPAPYKPEILHAMDTSNFDPVEPRTDFEPSSKRFGTEKISKHDHAFYEFTFRRFFDSDGYGCPTLKSRTPYQHPPLDTVMERAQTSQPDEPEENGVGRDYSRAYDRTPVYLNEQVENILRISTDEDEPRMPVQRRQIGRPTVDVHSGPGRPNPQDSFSFDDAPHGQHSDVDDETSDSAVYV